MIYLLNYIYSIYAQYNILFTKRGRINLFPWYKMHLVFIYLTEKGNNSANIYIIRSDFGLCKKQKDIIVDC